MAKNYRKNYKHSLETRKKLSISNTGKKHTEEEKIKIALWNLGKKASLKTRIKMSKSAKEKGVGKWMRNRNTKENSKWWKGGISILNVQIRSHFKYRQWRSDVFTKDNFQCIIGGKEHGNKLNAHHIDAFSVILKKNNIKTLEEALNCDELWNINNGRTLCISCHRKTDNYARKVIDTL